MYKFNPSTKQYDYYLDLNDLGLSSTDSPTFAGLTVPSITAPNDLTLNFGSEKTLVLSDTVWDDLRIIPSAFDFAGVTDPSIVDYQPGGSGTTFKVWEFQVNDHGFFTCQIPHGYKVGTDIHCHVHWTPGTRGNEESGKVVAWKLDYSWANITGTFGASQSISMADTVTGTDHYHEMSPDTVIDGHTAAKGISSMLICKISRDSTGDTWAGTNSGQLPILLEVDFHFEIDTIGSRQIGTK